MHTPHVRNLCGRQATKAINRVCLYYMQSKVDVKHFLRLLFFYVLRKYGKRSFSAEDFFGDKLGTHTAVVRTVAASCNKLQRSKPSEHIKPFATNGKTPYPQVGTPSQQVAKMIYMVRMFSKKMCPILDRCAAVRKEVAFQHPLE